MYSTYSVFNELILSWVSQVHVLTHWGRAMHICVSKLPTICSDDGLAPGRRQAIIWTNDGILLIGPLWTNFSEILIGIKTFSFKKMHLKMLSAKWRPFFPSLNVLMTGVIMTKTARTHVVPTQYMSTLWYPAWTPCINSILSSVFYHYISKIYHPGFIQLLTLISLI